MTPETIGTLSALALGLFGSSHCIGMCGGISGAFGLANPAQQVKKNLGLAVSFNLGRILSYALIGFIFGIFGALANEQFTAISNVMRIFAAALLVFMGLYVAGINSTITLVEKLGKGVWRLVQPLTRRFIPVTNNTSALCLGGLWGWLPCGLVYSTLIWAVSSGSASQSAWLMFCFGLGTLPAMISTTFFAQSVKHWLQKKWLRVIAGFIIIAMGGLTLSHALMDHSGMDHGSMNHGAMSNGAMDHGNMTDDAVEKQTVDHRQMDHGAMETDSSTTQPVDHSTMQH